MPVSTPDIKVANVRHLGGKVEMVGESYQETQAAAVQMSARDGLIFIPPYDDPYTIAGQGTIGDEIMRQVGDPEKLDAIFVPIGGGGLIAGIAAYTKALWPHIKVRRGTVFGRVSAHFTALIFLFLLCLRVGADILCKD